MDRSICRQLLSLSLLAAILAPCSAAADEARYTLAPDKMQKISNRAVELVESDAGQAVVRVGNNRVIVHDGPASIALIDELARSWRE
ncbi:MAG: hypothetical protein RBS80_05660 [Thermoguttaceae bacterium]|jgi:hypothetical protein|nr:hypothetical protein [Thermoguttaceae bacterium]